MPPHTPDPESHRLAEDAARKANWKRWGPYLSERQWATVREDYSPDGDCWSYFPHDLPAPNLIPPTPRSGARPPAARRLDCSDVDLSHRHHRIERALRGDGIGVGDRSRQGDRR